MTRDSLRIGVVGVGFGSTVHIPAFQSEGIDVVAVCSRRQERAEEAAKRFGIPNVFTDYEEMLKLDGLDAVSIATPPALHAVQSIAALRAGKHVICEKPFAVNEAEARSMYEAAQETGKTAMIAHEFRYSSGRAWTKELIDQGYIGQHRMTLMRLILGGPAQITVPQFSPDRDNAARGGGFLFGLGSHYIDCLRHWFGEVESVSGDVTTYLPNRMRGDEVIQADADDTFSFTLNFVNGGFAQMIATRAAPFGSGPVVEVYGSEGSLSVPQTGVNPPALGTVLGARVGEQGHQALPVPERLQPIVDDRDERLAPFRLLVRDFIKGIEDGTSHHPNFYDGLKCQQIMDAVRESSETGRRVMLANDIASMRTT